MVMSTHQLWQLINLHTGLAILT